MLAIAFVFQSWLPLSVGSIIEVEATGPLMDQVQALWRRESATLGFMTKGGFIDAAYNRSLLAWCDESNGLLSGYILYRITRAGIRIAHLCVSSESRSNGIAISLAEAVSARHPTALNIGLSCRNDYGLDKFWGRLGFAPRHYRKGRGQDGATLVFWVRDNGHEDLFSAARDERVEAVIDTCVFYDLVDDESDPKGEESRRLNEEWIEDSITLLVTQEIHHDMHRDSDIDRRERRRGQSGRFFEARASVDLFRNALDKIEAILPKAKDEQTESDYRHLAWALAGKIPHFVTRDGPLLDFREKILPLGLQILSPAEFARRIDELERSEVYRPEDIQGCGLQFLSVDETWLAKVDPLAVTHAGESPTRLKTEIRRIMANARHNRVRVVSDRQGQLLALIGEEMVDGPVVTICLARFAGTRSDQTLARYVVHKLIREATTAGNKTLKIADPLMPDCFLQALLYLGFDQSSSGELTRICANGIFSQEQVTAICGTLPIEPEKKEARIWPIKIADMDESVYIVPIRPVFAADLFDHELAGSQLIRIIPDTLLQDECVYYSGTRNSLKTPGRILWYVSQGEGYSGTMAIRACSFLIGCERDVAKQVFKRYRRYGVFEWAEIKRMVKDVEKDKLTVLRFCHTENFKYPIPLEEVKVITKEPPAWPLEIKHADFLRLYRRGMGL